MYYFAQFEKIDGQIFRFDTRVYLQPYQEEHGSTCVGAIVAKNPGSAIYRELGGWAPLELNGDRMLPTVRKRFINVYQKAGKEIPENSFIRVWNLFYLCNPDLGKACCAISNFNIIPECPSERDDVKIIWYAWGNNDKFLNKFKTRFLNKTNDRGFFYNQRTKMVSDCSPSETDFAKHPQGMPSEPVEHYLKSRLFG